MENETEENENAPSQSKLSVGLSCDSCLHKSVCKVLPVVKEVITESGVVEQRVDKTWPLASWLALVIGNHCSYSE